ncbi:MAG: hypothetical protein H7Y36_10305 [Armatimonadetes bacterium]|nr:hypothetical protein [Akkermansiaceae bacterium]
MKPRIFIPGAGDEFRSVRAKVAKTGRRPGKVRSLGFLHEDHKIRSFTIGVS